MNKSIFILALVWAYMYNSHFGWNWSSIICDVIFAILIALSMLSNLRKKED